MLRPEALPADAQIYGTMAVSGGPAKTTGSARPSHEALGLDAGRAPQPAGCGG